SSHGCRAAAQGGTQTDLVAASRWDAVRRSPSRAHPARWSDGSWAGGPAGCASQQQASIYSALAGPGADCPRWKELLPARFIARVSRQLTPAFVTSRIAHADNSARANRTQARSNRRISAICGRVSRYGTTLPWVDF